MPGQLVSDWICICTAGTAIDGRAIEEQWLLEAAEHYDTNFYTAMVWPYHSDDLREREFYVPNYGIIKELKTERVGEDVKLYARFAPNQFLIEANKQSQKLFTSCEFWPDFQNKGFFYLQAVAVTDIPASVGTDMLQFSARNNRSHMSQSLQFSLGNLSPEKSPGLLDRILASMPSRSFSTTTPTGTEEDPQKMDELKQLLQQMMQAINDLRDAAKGNTTDNPDDAANEVRDQAEEIATIAEEVAQLADDVASNPEDEVVAEEFSACREELAEKLKAFTAGRSRFSARRRRAHRAFSTTRRQSGSSVEKKLDKLIEAFSAVAGKSGTRLPNKAPGGSDKDIELL